MPEARQAIEARGEKPLPLLVEPSGAEFARPQRAFEHDATDLQEPDPDDRVQHDQRGFIQAERIVVPGAIAPGSAARVHLIFRPNARIRAHWNNESSPMQLWVSPPPGWQVDRRQHTLPNAGAAATRETRRLEFELRAPEDAAAGTVKIPAYALYNVCEGADGTCLYRRQNITVELKVTDAK